MQHFLALILIGVCAVSVQAQSSETSLEKRIASDVRSFEEEVMGDIPALALSAEQKDEVASIYREMYQGLLHLDPYTDGKREVSIAYRDGRDKALKESLTTLSTEQRLSYMRHKNKKPSRR